MTNYEKQEIFRIIPKNNIELPFMVGDLVWFLIFNNQISEWEVLCAIVDYMTVHVSKAPEKVLTNGNRIRSAKNLIDIETRLVFRINNTDTYINRRWAFNIQDEIFINIEDAEKEKERLNKGRDKKKGMIL